LFWKQFREAKMDSMEAAPRRKKGATLSKSFGL
jgi:hypothetical protein